MCFIVIQMFCLIISMYLTIWQWYSTYHLHASILNATVLVLRSFHLGGTVNYTMEYFRWLVLVVT